MIVGGNRGPIWGYFRGGLLPPVIGVFREGIIKNQIEKSGCGAGVSVRASLHYLKDEKMVDYIPDESSIAAFRERVSGIIGSVCAEEFVAKLSFMGCPSGAITGICARFWGERGGLRTL